MYEQLYTKVEKIVKSADNRNFLIMVVAFVVVLFAANFFVLRHKINRVCDYDNWDRLTHDTASKSPEFYEKFYLDIYSDLCGPDTRLEDEYI